MHLLPTIWQQFVHNKGITIIKLTHTYEEHSNCTRTHLYKSIYAFFFFLDRCTELKHLSMHKYLWIIFVWGKCLTSLKKVAHTYAISYDESNVHYKVKPENQELTMYNENCRFWPKTYWPDNIDCYRKKGVYWNIFYLFVNKSDAASPKNYNLKQVAQRKKLT